MKLSCKAVTFLELMVVISIIFILAGMVITFINAVNKPEAKQPTTATSSSWNTTENKTPGGTFQTYILTNPETHQMWLIVTRNSNNVAIYPYTPPTPPTTVEATH